MDICVCRYKGHKKSSENFPQIIAQIIFIKSKFDSASLSNVFQNLLGKSLISETCFQATGAGMIHAFITLPRLHSHAIALQCGSIQFSLRTLIILFFIDWLFSSFGSKLNSTFFVSLPSFLHLV
jgi:hypothetical protein